MQGPQHVSLRGGQSPCLQESLPSREGLLGIRECGLGVYVTVCLFLWVFLQILQRRPPLLAFHLRFFFFDVDPFFSSIY